MSLENAPRTTDRLTWRSYRAAGLLGTLLFSGFAKEDDTSFTSVADPPTVQVIQPSTRDIVRTVGQPSFIQAYEHTAIYAKLPSYIEKWIVDIGDKVKKNQVLATLFMPELVEELETKKADVALAREMIEQALKLVDVATADVAAAEARLAEAKAILAKFQAELDRWDTEVKRLSAEVQRQVVSPQILLESQNQLKSSTAARDAAGASIMTARADLLSRQAALAKAKVDVGVARAVGRCHERRETPRGAGGLPDADRAL